MVRFFQKFLFDNPKADFVINMTSVSKHGYFENSLKKFITVFRDKFQENIFSLFLNYKSTAQLGQVQLGQVFEV